MAWRRSGDKPLSEPMMVRLPTHICVTWPQWIKTQYRLDFWYIYEWGACPDYDEKATDRMRKKILQINEMKCGVWNHYCTWLMKLYCAVPEEMKRVCGARSPLEELIWTHDLSGGNTGLCFETRTSTNLIEDDVGVVYHRICWHIEMKYDEVPCLFYIHMPSATTCCGRPWPPNANYIFPLYVITHVIYDHT